MLGKHKFRVGQRVRLSERGLAANLLPKSRRGQSGVVVKVDLFNSPSVLWEWRKTASSYHPDFIAPDRRRRSSQP